MSSPTTVPSLYILEDTGLLRNKGAVPRDALKHALYGILYRNNKGAVPRDALKHALYGILCLPPNVWFFLNFSSSPWALHGSSQREQWARRGFHFITTSTATAYSKQTLNSHATSVAWRAFKRQTVGYLQYFKWARGQYYTFCVTVPTHTLKERRKERKKQTNKESKHSYNFVTLYGTVVTIRTASLTFTNPTFCPHTVVMCFVWISEQTAIISLYSINWLVFITETECLRKTQKL